MSNFWESDKQAKDYILKEGRNEERMPIGLALDEVITNTPLYSMIISQGQVIASIRKVKSVENMSGIIWIEGNEADFNFDIRLISDIAQVAYSYTDPEKIEEISFFDKKRGLEYKVFYVK